MNEPARQEPPPLMVSAPAPEGGEGPGPGAPSSAASGAQENALEACLIFLGAKFDLPISLAGIRANQVGEGAMTTPQQFALVAERFGLAAVPAALDVDQMTSSLMPVVGMLRDAGALVLSERIDEQHFVAHDPRLPGHVIRITKADLLKSFGGLAIVVRPEHRPRTHSADVQPGRLRGHWFLQPLANNWWIYAQVLLAAAVANVLGLTISIFTMTVYNRVLPNNAVDSLIALTVGVVIAIAFDFIVRMLRSAFIDRAGQRADLVIGRQIFDHLLDMQMKSRSGSAGALASMVREFETLRDFFTSASVVAIVDLPFILMFIAVIALIGGPLALIPALAVPIVVVLGIVVQPMLAKLVDEGFQEGQTKQGVLVEAISGLETIKATGAAPVMRQRWEESIRHQSGIGIKSRLISQLVMNAANFTQQVAQVAIIFYGVFLINDAVISMGALIASVMLMSRCLAPLGQLAQTLTRMNQARSSYQSLDKMMKTVTERPVERRFVSRPTLFGKIEFKDVSFKYPNQPNNVLNKVSFSLQAGERVAIVGRIGSGKSTIARLLLGLYEPTEGVIHVDDTDIRQVDPADLRHNLGAVLQDIWLFSGTVRQNIAVGAARARDEEILRAAISSGVHDFISQSPLGYDLVLAERGEGLSGGQRQSIALARAIVRDPPILLFDEPTSMMDMQTEQAVISRLKHIVHQKTVVVITHRLSLLELVDRVIVIDQGKVVVDGPKSILKNGLNRKGE